MINFTSISKGYQDRGDENRVERRKVAEAFEQFKRSNPEATLAQFQQYIDGVSGGRNYLAGGAGSGEALRKLASDNQARKARRLAAESQASLIAQFKNEMFMQESLQDEINNALLNAKPTKPREGPEGRLAGVQPRINYAQVARDFAENNPLVGKMGFDLSDMFTSDQRGQVMSDLTEKELPKVQQYINGLSAADLENVDLDDITRMFRMNPIIAEATLNKAKGIAASEKEVAIADLVNTAKKDIINMASEGDVDLGQVPNYLKEMYGHLPLYEEAFGEKNIDALVTSISGPIERKITEREKQKALERGTRKSTVTASVLRLLQGESDRSVSNLKRPMGFDLEKNRLLNLAQGVMTDEFRAELTGSNTGTSDGMPSVGELDAIIESFLQGVAQEKVSNYEETTAAARIKARTDGPLARQAAIAANVKVGMDAYANSGTQGAAQSGSNELAGQVMSILGQKYVMDPVTLGVIGKMLPTFVGDDGVKAGDDGMRMSAAEMANEIEVALGKTNGVQGTAGLVARAEQIARAKLIGPDSLTFSQYEERMTKSIDESETNVLELAQDAYSAGLNGDPAAIDGLKRLLKRHTTETIPYYKSLTEAHRGTSKIWINNADERNSHWDQRRVDAMLGSLENGTVMQTINKMIEEISLSAAEESRTMPSVKASVVQAVSNEPDQAQVISSNLTDVMAAHRTRQIALGIIPPPSNANPAGGGDPEPNPNVISAVNLKRAEELVAKAKETGVVPPYATMADEGERRDWRNAFEKTHHRDGSKIQSFGEKANQIGSEVYNDAQSVYRYLTD